jgi:hypothetical protein
MVSFTFLVLREIAVSGRRVPMDPILSMIGAILFKAKEAKGMPLVILRGQKNILGSKCLPSQRRLFSQSGKKTVSGHRRTDGCPAKMAFPTRTGGGIL